MHVVEVFIIRKTYKRYEKYISHFPEPHRIGVFAGQILAPEPYI